MVHYNRDDVAKALRQVGLEKGDVVFSHSNIGYFGVPEGERTKVNAFTTILNGFFDVLGEEGTLVVPTFTYSFPKGEVFNIEATPSDCGFFTELFRQHPASVRSEDPSVSVAAMGRHARALMENVGGNSYDENSFFHRFYEMSGKICNLNFDSGSTFIHYVERALNVPYRYDKSFSGTFENGQLSEVRTSTIWVRDISSDETTAAFEPFDQLAKEKGLCVSVPLGRGSVTLITAADTVTLIKETLPERPWFLTRAEISGVVPDLKREGVL